MRYLRLYLHFLRFSFSRSLEFRVDFFFRIGMDVVYYAAELTFFSVLYLHTPLLGGWNLDQIYVFVCGVLFVDAAAMTIFSNNLWWLPIFVNQGDLDYYLVRPVSPLFFLGLRDFAANSFLNLALAGSLVGWSLWRYPAPLAAGQVAIYLALLGLGVVIYFFFRLAFILPVFWLHSSRGLDELSWTLWRLAERPHRIYADWLRLALVTVLPVALAISVPVEVLFGGATVAGVSRIVLVVGLFAAAVGVFWRVALRAYSSASS